MFSRVLTGLCKGGSYVKVGFRDLVGTDLSLCLAADWGRRNDREICEKTWVFRFRWDRRAFHKRRGSASACGEPPSHNYRTLCAVSTGARISPRRDSSPCRSGRALRSVVKRSGSAARAVKHMSCASVSGPASGSMLLSPPSAQSSKELPRRTGPTG
jgi:hypothetical protein